MNLLPTDCDDRKLEVLTRRHNMLHSVKVKLLDVFHNGLLCFV